MNLPPRLFPSREDLSCSFNRWLPIIGLFFTSLLTLSIFRLAFTLWNRSSFGAIRPSSVGWAFLHGLRFDIATTCLLILPGWVLFQTPFAQGKGYLSKASLVISVIPFWTIFPICMADLLYFKDSGRRLSYEVFRLNHDWKAAGAMIVSYKIPMIITLIAVVLFSWLTLLIFRASSSKNLIESRLRNRWLALLWGIPFLLIGLRGGLQSKPIRPSFAYLTGHPSLAQIALNPVFTVFYAVKKGDVATPRYYPEANAIRTVQTLVHHPGSLFSDLRFPLYQVPAETADHQVDRPNIVIMMLESWSGKYVGAVGDVPGITPNFDRLADQGTLFTSFFAAGHRSTDGISATCCSTPTYEDLQIIGTPLEQNRFRCLATLLREAGYSTMFLHGAKTGSFGLNAFSKVAGFERYVGKEDFGLGPNDADGVWGVYDLVALNRLNQELRNAEKPVFAFWFSLTSHSPYRLPSEKYRTTPATTPDHELIDTLRYSDESLGRFFETASKEAYFANTLFILLADHTAGEGLKGTKERQHIPCLFYAPGRIPATRIGATGSQSDILPTLLDLLDLRTPFATFGRSLFQPGLHFAFVNLGGHAGWFEDNQLLLTQGPEVLGFYQWKEDPYELKNMRTERAEAIDLLKERALSYVQISKDLIRSNRLIPMLSSSR